MSMHFRNLTSSKAQKCVYQINGCIDFALRWRNFKNDTGWQEVVAFSFFDFPKKISHYSPKSDTFVEFTFCEAVFMSLTSRLLQQFFNWRTAVAPILLHAKNILKMNSTARHSHTGVRCRCRDRCRSMFANVTSFCDSIIFCDGTSKRPSQNISL